MKARKALRHAFITAYLNASLVNAVREVRRGDEFDMEPVWGASRANLSWSALKDLVRDALDFIDMDHVCDVSGNLLAILSATRHPQNGSVALYAQAGHDFSLTRNRHGSGFWDGGWPEPWASLFTADAHAYGPFTLSIPLDGDKYEYLEG